MLVSVVRAHSEEPVLSRSSPRGGQLIVYQYQASSSLVYGAKFIPEFSGAVYTLANVSNVLCDEHLRSQVYSSIAQR